MMHIVHSKEFLHSDKGILLKMSALETLNDG